MRPIVGITSYAENARWGVWEAPAALIPLSYVRAVEDAGGRALLVPPSVEGVEETLDALDGLVLSGGADLDPASYGAEAHPETTTSADVRVATVQSRTLPAKPVIRIVGPAALVGGRTSRRKRCPQECQNSRRHAVRRVAA